MISECKELLDKSGIPYVNSIGEADPQCVGMQHYYKICQSFKSQKVSVRKQKCSCRFKYGKVHFA